MIIVRIIVSVVVIIPMSILLWYILYVVCDWSYGVYKSLFILLILTVLSCMLVSYCINYYIEYKMEADKKEQQFISTLSDSERKQYEMMKRTKPDDVYIPIPIYIGR